jgi:hypothetical protein
MSIFDKETLELIQTTAVRADGAKDKVQVVALPGDPTGRYLIAKPDGTFETTEPGSAPREHMLLSVEQVAPTAAHYKDGYDPIVWYSPSGVTIVLDDSVDSRRLDVITCPLNKTPAFEFFSCKAEGTWFEQKAFVRKLRVALADCLTETSAELLRTVRVLSFASSTTGHGKIELGRESIGRDLEAELRSDAGEIPEKVSFNVRLFNDPVLTTRRQIVCGFDIEPREGKFNLCPLAGEIDRVLDEEMNSLATRLEAVGEVPLIFGTP